MVKIKTVISNFAMLVAYCCGFDSFFYLLNRKAKRIVTFHNVLPDEGFKWNPETGFSHSESQFRKIVRELARRYSFSTDLFDSRTLTITFDDGNLNQFEIAAKVLKEEGNVPAILFVSRKFRDDGVEGGLVVDKLCYWASYAPESALQELAGGRKLSRSEFWSKVLRPMFAQDAGTKGQEIFSRLDALYSFDKLLEEDRKYARLRMARISDTDLDILRARHWVIGWHTESHFPLSSLSREEQKKEMLPPEEFKHVVFSYPYGELKSVNEISISLAKEIGFPCAVSDITDAGLLHGKFFLPRYDMPRYDTFWSRYRLHFYLSGLHHFLRTFKLLPRVYS